MFVKTVCQCEFPRWASEALCSCGHRCFYEALFVPEDILGESGSEGLTSWLSGHLLVSSAQLVQSLCIITNKIPWSRVPKLYLFFTRPLTYLKALPVLGA